MCGFAGIISNENILKDRLLNISSKILYRGPDHQGFYTHNNNYQHIGLLHNRLSILDTSSNGNQPMLSKNKKIILAFNGEIYNFKHLKSEFLSELDFETTSDTEVIIKLYEKFGIDFIRHLRGMFSISLIDLSISKLYLIRDRLGVKPLYFHESASEFRFGSELKTVTENDKFNIDKSSVANFIQFGYIPSNKTIFKGVNKLKPGHLLTLDLKTRKFKIKQYWNLNDYVSSSTFKQDQVKQLKDIKEAVLLRCVSDVPISVFQSGGYDSSLVSSILKNSSINFTCFNIGFDSEKYDESKHAKNILEHLNKDLKIKKFQFSDTKNILKVMNDLYDEPFADPSSLPTLMLSKFTACTHKVALSADGGDELFGGYDKHVWTLKIHKISKTLFKWPLVFIISVFLGLNSLFRLNNFFNIRNLRVKLLKIKSCLIASDPIKILEIISKYVPDFELKKIMYDTENKYSFLNYKPINGDTLQKILCVDLQTHLPDQILYKVDRCTMRYSLEAREPLVDQDLIKKYINLNSNSKIFKKISKYTIRKLVWSFIPKNIIDKPKQGFSIPLKELLFKDFKPIAEDLLSEKNLSHGIFKTKNILKLKKDFYKGDDINERQLWHLLVFQMWYKKWKVNIKI